MNFHNGGAIPFLCNVKAFGECLYFCCKRQGSQAGNSVSSSVKIISRAWLEVDNSQKTETMKLKGRLEVWKMGLVQYSRALILQERLVNKRRMGIIPDTLLSLQHPPTYTLGRRRTTQNLLISPLDIQNMGASIHYTERGGDVTFHGPHQAILYPIISLRESGLGVRKYVEHLEDTVIKLASLYGVQAQGRMKGETGVWVSDRKIGAIGVRVSSGITSHGLAFNIDPDLSYYSHIVPCGIPDKEVTSLRREAQITLPAGNVVTQHLIDSFIDVFDIRDVSWNESNSILYDIEDLK